MSEFHLFAQLPAELRFRIWNMTSHARLVHVATRMEPGVYSDVACIASSTPCPPVMQVCQESRRRASYRRAFTIGSNPRYTWVDFETDMICIADDNLADPALKPHRHEIQRLRITAGSERSYDHFYRCGNEYLQQYGSLRAFHVFLEYNILVWSSTFEDCAWGSCPKENIRFIDADSGLMLTGDQLSMAYDWGTFHSWDGDGRVLDSDNLSEEIEDAQYGRHLKLHELRAIE